MPEKVLLVAHRDTSDPGRVGSVLSSLGYELDLRRPACGDTLPATMDDHAGVVVFGGSMSANDDHLPFIRTELEWIPGAVDSGKPYLGICLGAQLLGRTLGARVGPHPEGLHEIGYYPIVPTAAGAGLFDPEMHVFQWHGEGLVDLPEESVLLAQSTHFPAQAYRWGDNAYGLQFHPEVTETMARMWSRMAAHRLVLPGAQSREEQQEKRVRHDAAVAAWLERFLRRWLGWSNAPAEAALAVPVSEPAAF